MSVESERAFEQGGYVKTELLRGPWKDKPPLETTTYYGCPEGKDSSSGIGSSSISSGIGSSSGIDSRSNSSSISSNGNVKSDSNANTAVNPDISTNIKHAIQQAIIDKIIGKKSNEVKVDNDSKEKNAMILYHNNPSTANAAESNSKQLVLSIENSESNTPQKELKIDSDSDSNFDFDVFVKGLDGKSVFQQYVAIFNLLNEHGIELDEVIEEIDGGGPTQSQKKDIKNKYLELENKLVDAIIKFVRDNPTKETVGATIRLLEKKQFKGFTNTIMFHDNNTTTAPVSARVQKRVFEKVQPLTQNFLESKRAAQKTDESKFYTELNDKIKNGVYIDDANNKIYLVDDETMKFIQENLKPSTSAIKIETQNNPVNALIDSNIKNKTSPFVEPHSVSSNSSTASQEGDNSTVHTGTSTETNEMNSSVSSQRSSDNGFEDNTDEKNQGELDENTYQTYINEFNTKIAEDTTLQQQLDIISTTLEKIHADSNINEFTKNALLESFNSIAEGIKKEINDTGEIGTDNQDNYSGDESVNDENDSKCDAEIENFIKNGGNIYYLNLRQLDLTEKISINKQEIQIPKKCLEEIRELLKEEEPKFIKKQIKTHHKNLKNSIEEINEAIKRYNANLVRFKDGVTRKNVFPENVKNAFIEHLNNMKNDIIKEKIGVSIGERITSVNEKEIQEPEVNNDAAHVKKAISLAIKKWISSSIANKAILEYIETFKTTQTPDLFGTYQQFINILDIIKNKRQYLNLETPTEVNFFNSPRFALNLYKDFKVDEKIIKTIETNFIQEYDNKLKEYQINSSKESFNETIIKLNEQLNANSAVHNFIRMFSSKTKNKTYKGKASAQIKKQEVIVKLKEIVERFLQEQQQDEPQVHEDKTNANASQKEEETKTKTPPDPVSKQQLANIKELVAKKIIEFIYFGNISNLDENRKTLYKIAIGLLYDQTIKLGEKNKYKTTVIPTHKGLLSFIPNINKHTVIEDVNNSINVQEISKQIRDTIINFFKGHFRYLLAIPFTDTTIQTYISYLATEMNSRKNIKSELMKSYIKFSFVPFFIQDFNSIEVKYTYRITDQTDALKELIKNTNNNDNFKDFNFTAADLNKYKDVEIIHIGEIISIYNDLQKKSKLDADVKDYNTHLENIDYVLYYWHLNNMNSNLFYKNIYTEPTETNEPTETKEEPTRMQTFNNNITEAAQKSVYEGGNSLITYNQQLNNKRIMTFLKINKYAGDYNLNVYKPIVRNGNELVLGFRNTDGIYWKNWKYLSFGNFNKIYLPPGTNDSQKINKEIVIGDGDGKQKDKEPMYKLIDLAIQAKDVFIIGYGSSGSGKTSTLIYNTKTHEEGVTVTLCEELCSKYNATVVQHNNEVPEYNRGVMEYNNVNSNNNNNKIRNSNLAIMAKNTEIRKYNDSIKTFGDKFKDYENINFPVEEYNKEVEKYNATQNNVENSTDKKKNKTKLRKMLKYKKIEITHIKMEVCEITETGNKHERKLIFDVNHNTDNNTYTIVKNESIPGNTYEELHGKTKSDNNVNTLGSFLKYFITNDRNIHSTMNNPESSRSHVTCTLTFCNESGLFIKSRRVVQINGLGRIIVGDFAGVENSFDNENMHTFQKFYEKLTSTDYDNIVDMKNIGQMKKTHRIENNMKIGDLIKIYNNLFVDNSIKHVLRLRFPDVDNPEPIIFSNDNELQDVLKNGLNNVVDNETLKEENINMDNSELNEVFAVIDSDFLKQIYNDNKIKKSIDTFINEKVLSVLLSKAGTAENPSGTKTADTLKKEQMLAGKKYFFKKIVEIIKNTYDFKNAPKMIKDNNISKMIIKNNVLLGISQKPPDSHIQNITQKNKFIDKFNYRQLITQNPDWYPKTSGELKEAFNGNNYHTLFINILKNVGELYINNIIQKFEVYMQRHVKIIESNKVLTDKYNEIHERLKKENKLHENAIRFFDYLRNKKMLENDTTINLPSEEHLKALFGETKYKAIKTEAELCEADFFREREAVLKERKQNIGNRYNDPTIEQDKIKPITKLELEGIFKRIDNKKNSNRPRTARQTTASEDATKTNPNSQKASDKYYFNKYYTEGRIRYLLMQEMVPVVHLLNKIKWKINKLPIPRNDDYIENKAIKLANLYHETLKKSKKEESEAESEEEKIQKAEEKAEENAEDAIVEKEKEINRYEYMYDFINDISRISEHIVNRNTEGKFINKELKNIREDIAQCMLVKSSFHIFTAPTMNTNCMNTFCEDDICFTIKKPKNAQNIAIKSSTFQFLFEKFYPIELEEEQTPEKIQQKRKEFYNNLQISIFTVFNMNDTTDYPPNITYIDDYHDGWVKNDTKDAETDTKKKSVDPFLFTEPKSGSADALFKSIEASIHDRNSGFTKNKMGEDTYNEVVKKIDQHNATTTLGTLIFTDNMSKFANADESFKSRTCILDNEKWDAILKETESKQTVPSDKENEFSHEKNEKQHSNSEFLKETKPQETEKEEKKYKYTDDYYDGDDNDKKTSQHYTPNDGNYEDYFKESFTYDGDEYRKRQDTPKQNNASKNNASRKPGNFSRKKTKEGPKKEETTGTEANASRKNNRTKRNLRDNNPNAKQAKADPTMPDVPNDNEYQKNRDDSTYAEQEHNWNKNPTKEREPNAKKSPADFFNEYLKKGANGKNTFDASLKTHIRSEEDRNTFKEFQREHVLKIYKLYITSITGKNMTASQVKQAKNNARNNFSTIEHQLFTEFDNDKGTTDENANTENATPKMQAERLFKEYRKMNSEQKQDFDEENKILFDANSNLKEEFEILQWSYAKSKFKEFYDKTKNMADDDKEKERKQILINLSSYEKPMFEELVNTCKSHYAILGLNKGASDTDIKRAYHKLALIYSQDKNTYKSEEEQEKAKIMFRKLNDAKEILLGTNLKEGHSSKTERQYYDEQFGNQGVCKGTAP